MNWKIKFSFLHVYNTKRRSIDSCNMIQYCSFKFSGYQSNELHFICIVSTDVQVIIVSYSSYVFHLRALSHENFGSSYPELLICIHETHKCYLRSIIHENFWSKISQIGFLFCLFVQLVKSSSYLINLCALNEMKQTMQCLITPSSFRGHNSLPANSRRSSIESGRWASLPPSSSFGLISGWCPWRTTLVGSMFDLWTMGLPETQFKLWYRLLSFLVH